MAGLIDKSGVPTLAALSEPISGNHLVAAYPPFSYWDHDAIPKVHSRPQARQAQFPHFRAHALGSEKQILRQFVLQLKLGRVRAGLFPFLKKFSVSIARLAAPS